MFSPTRVCNSVATLQHCNTATRLENPLGNLDWSYKWKDRVTHIYEDKTAPRPKLSLVIAKPEKEQEQEKEAACNFNPFLGRNL